MGFWLAAALVAGLAVAAYWNVLPGDFVFDDNLVVLRDARIRGPLSSGWHLFEPGLDAALHRPLRTFSYLVDYNVGGLDPKVFHAGNLIYHVLGAWAALAIALRLTGSLGAATATAALFVIHPVQTDAVSYISGRRDVLCGLFFFLTVACYIRYREGGQKGWLGAALVSEVLALLSKEMAATLPAVLLLVDVWRQERPTLVSRAVSALRRHWGAYVTAGLLCALCLSIYYRGTIASEAARTPWYGGSVTSNLATSARIWVHYLRVLLYPDRLIADYEGWFRLSRSLAEGEALSSLAAVAALLVSGAYLLGRASLTGFGLAWFGLTLLPVSHLMPYHELMAEHYLYIPSFGLALVAGSALGRLGTGSGGRRVAAILVAASLMAALGARTILRNRDWRTSLAFYTALTRDNPKAVRGHLGMAVTLLKSGLTQPAVRELKQALELDSDDPRTLLDLGIAVHQIGWRHEAERRYKSALAKRPAYPQALNNLALLYIEQRRYDEARPLLETAESLTRRGDATVLATFGLFYEVQGRASEALPYYREALRLRPDRKLLEKKVALLSGAEEAQKAGKEEGNGPAVEP